MSERVRASHPAERPPIEIRELRGVEEIREFFKLVDPMLDVDWGKEGAPEKYRPEYIAAHPEETVIFGAYEDGVLIGGAKITILDSDTEASLRIPSDRRGRRGVLLEYAAVREQNRRQGVMTELIKRRLEWAKGHEAAYVCSQFDLDNPVSGYTKVKEGFVIVSVCPPEKGGPPVPYLVCMKDLSPSEKPGEGRAVSRQERREAIITLDSLDELTALFAAGWIGVGMRFTEKQTPWTLIMERRTGAVAKAK